ncbi:MAG: metallophosphoesterase [bacterium]|nr:metallophosphoesterase [bacterium]
MHVLNIMRVAAVIMAFGGGTGTARADWSFVMLGDTRGDGPTTTTGVSLHLNTIAQKIALVNPDLVLMAGDLINGPDIPTNSSLSYTQQYSNWQTAMAPITASNIALYCVRGNHDNDRSAPELKQAYYDAVGAFMPTNGPTNGATDDQRGFTYSFSYNNATFFALDQYFYYDKTSESGYHSIDQSWLDQQLHAASTPHKIVMAHEPVYMTTGESGEEHFFGTDAEAETRRTNFWNSLGNNGARLYLCGHVHVVSVGLINDHNGTGIYQLTAGNGGAPFEPIFTNHDTGVSVLYTNGSNFGFAYATVGDIAMTINYYLLNKDDNSWSVAPYTTVIKTVPEPSSAALLAVVAGFFVWSRSRSARRPREVHQISA